MRSSDEAFENLDERGLALELVRSQKKTEQMMKRVFYAAIGIFAALAVALIVVIPPTYRTMRSMEALAQKTDKLTDDATVSLGNINEMVDNVNQVVVENTESVNVMLNNFNSIDFEQLNKAIEDLANVVKPLSNFANLFQR